MVATPMEPLSLYLAASDRAVGIVLIREESDTQRPVYYVNHVLKVPQCPKFALAPVMASRKQWHNFQGRKIKLITNHPRRNCSTNPTYLGGLLIGLWNLISSTWPPTYER